MKKIFQFILIIALVITIIVLSSCIIKGLKSLNDLTQSNKKVPESDIKHISNTDYIADAGESIRVSYKGPVETEPTIPETSHIVEHPTFSPSNYYRMYRDVPLSNELKGYVFDACKQYDVPVYIVFAFMDKGSHFDPNFGNDIKYGIMCIPIKYIKDLDRLVGYDVTIVKDNIYAGVRYISNWMGYTNNDLTRVAMCFEWSYPSAKNLWGSGVYTDEWAEEAVEKIFEYKAMETIND